MTKAKGNMYGWVDYIVDPVRFCSHKCVYCYAKKFQVKKPALNERVLKTIKGKGHNIFVGHLGDLFCAEMPSNIISELLAWLDLNAKGNSWVFQTKNPSRFLEFGGQFPLPCLLGTTIEGTEAKGFSEAPAPLTRIYGIAEVREYLNLRTFITIEPIIQGNLSTLLQWLGIAKPDYLNIGADSKGHKLPEPAANQIRWFISKVKELFPHTKIHLKPNLFRIMPLTKEQL